MMPRETHWNNSPFDLPRGDCGSVWGSYFSISPLGGMSLCSGPASATAMPLRIPEVGPALMMDHSICLSPHWTKCSSSSWGNRWGSSRRWITVCTLALPRLTLAIYEVEKMVPVSQGCWVHEIAAGWRSTLWSHAQDSTRLLHASSHWW